MKLQQLYSYVRQAIDDYQMIADGDRIAIGISGGKDSLTLLYALSGLRRFYPKKHVIKTKIGEIVFEERKESSPCALCAKMRKGALNDHARQIGCNKVAYAHHMDDIIETMFLSMFYEGQFYSFAPVTHLDRSGITVIRPLMYVPEANVIGFLHKYHLPLVKNPCPADGETKREYVKQLVRQINLENPGVKKRIFHAICTGRIEGWNINGKQ